MLIKLAILCLAVGIAMRGKGGGFITWGIFKQDASGNNPNFKMHALGAVMVAVSLCYAVGNWLWLPVFAAGWFLFTKPSPYLNFNTITANTATQRAEAIPMAAVRQALIIPLLAAIYVAAHGFHLDSADRALFIATAIASSYLLVMPYYVGGLLQRAAHIKDAVVFGEYGMLIAGGVFFLIIFAL